MCQAEEKLSKVGELLTGNADDNPEPSSSLNDEQACVETRRRVCIKCGNVITNKRKGLKFCSAKCRCNFNTQKSRVKYGLIKKPGVGSGGNQRGRKNHMYKNGIGSYSKKVFAFKDSICNRCGTKESLLAHHIDENRSNNEPDNLEILCKRCHQNHHTIRDSLGRYTKG